MNQFFVGSINLSKLNAQAKTGHSAFSKSAKNGNVYVNIAVWVNDEPNEFGQHLSLLLNSSKELKDKEGKTYIGNAKKIDTSQPVKASDVDTSFESNIPVRQTQTANSVSDTADDLPF